MITCQFEDGVQVELRHCTVDCVVVKDGKILLAKRHPKLDEAGKWCLPGGYMNRDETIKQAAAREVYEETGWEVTDLTLMTIRDNPNRRNDKETQNIVVSFFCRATKQTGKPDWESTEVKWFVLDDLPAPDQIAFDHAENIAVYRRHLREDTSLPVFV